MANATTMGYCLPIMTESLNLMRMMTDDLKAFSIQRFVYI